MTESNQYNVYEHSTYVDKSIRFPTICFYNFSIILAQYP